MEAAVLDPRQARGLALAKAKGGRIKPVAGSTWLVPSQNGSGGYIVDATAGSCSCPDAEENGGRCKHQWAVLYMRQEIPMPHGATLVTEARVTYRQDWPRYNAAQCEEKDRVQVLLRALCDGIAAPTVPRKRGQQPVKVADFIYNATMKVYTTVSGRRATSDVRACAERGLVDKALHYNTISEHMGRPEVTPLLQTLITQSAAPLKAIETQFAVDATGFATSTYARWYDEKYGGEKKCQRWLKAHASVGTRTHVVVAAEVTESNVHDSPMLPALVSATAANFNMRELSADKAYLSHDNLALIEAAGATPYIPFKVNSTPSGSPAWQRLWHLYSLNAAEFGAHYHRRSNVESAFSAIKRKFGGSVRAKTSTAQVNEVLLKILCHNLAAVVHSIHELNVEPRFWQPVATAAAAAP